MRQADKLEAMVTWFYQNYEDPVERTPYESAEGGYQWIWGGPYEASDVLSKKFYGIAPEKLINETVEHVEEDGITDWAPTPQPGDYDDDEGPPEKPPSLEIYLDEPSSGYGTSRELQARGLAKAAVDDVQAALAQRRHIGIGHNQPPEQEAEYLKADLTQVEELREAIPELSKELGKPKPAIAAVKRWAKPLRDALVATGVWAAKKLDKAVDAAVTAAGKTLAGGGVITALGFGDQIKHAFNAVITWLEIAAKALF